MSEHKTEGPLRVDVTDDMIGWATNALRFDTQEEAEAYANDLGGRWLAVKAWRIVPSDHPDREAVFPEVDRAAGRKVYVY